MIEDLNDVVKIALQRFPELNERVRQTFDYYDLTEEMPGPYLIFEDVIQKVVVELLEQNEGNPLLNRMFALFEELASSSNRGITGLLGIAIIEPLVFRSELIREAWSYMGEKTRKEAIKTARLAGWVENLPAGAIGPGNGH